MTPSPANAPSDSTLPSLPPVDVLVTRASLKGEGRYRGAGLAALGNRTVRNLTIERGCGIVTFDDDVRILGKVTAHAGSGICVLGPLSADKITSARSVIARSIHANVIATNDSIEATYGLSTPPKGMVLARNSIKCRELSADYVSAGGDVDIRDLYDAQSIRCESWIGFGSLDSRDLFDPFNDAARCKIEETLPAKRALLRETISLMEGFIDGAPDAGTQWAGQTVFACESGLAPAERKRFGEMPSMYSRTLDLALNEAAVQMASIPAHQRTEQMDEMEKRLEAMLVVPGLDEDGNTPEEAVLIRHPAQLDEENAAIRPIVPPAEVAKAPTVSKVGSRPAGPGE